MVAQYRKDHPENFKQVEASIPQRRLGKPEEIAELVAFLLNGEAKYLKMGTKNM